MKRANIYSFTPHSETWVSTTAATLKELFLCVLFLVNSGLTKST